MRLLDAHARGELVAALARLVETCGPSEVMWSLGVVLEDGGHEKAARAAQAAWTQVFPADRRRMPEPESIDVAASRLELEGE